MATRHRQTSTDVFATLAEGTELTRPSAYSAKTRRVHLLFNAESVGFEMGHEQACHGQRRR